MEAFQHTPARKSFAIGEDLRRGTSSNALKMGTNAEAADKSASLKTVSSAEPLIGALVGPHKGIGAVGVSLETKLLPSSCCADSLSSFEIDAQAPDAPDQPRLVGGRDDHEYMLVIEWDEPGDNGEAINEFWVDRHDPTGQVRNVHCGAGTQIRVGKPSKDSGVFRYTVKAHNARGWSDFSVPLVVDTSPAPPEAPLRPLLVSKQVNQMSLKWEPPYYNFALVDQYELFMAPGTHEAFHPESFVSIYSGDALTKQVTGLKPAFSYSFALRAKNSEGWSSFSNVSTFETL